MQECQSSQGLFDYLRQELPPDQVARVEAHLSHCAACRDELHRLRQQIQQVQAILAQLDPVPGRLPARSVSFIRLPRWALAFAATVMLILGAVMHLSGNQSALANSISRLKVIVDVSTGLYSATSMDCTLKIPDAGRLTSNYRARWSAAGITRVDLDPGSGMEKTLWISNTSNPPDPVWQPVMEFLTPAILAQHMEKHYGLAQIVSKSGAGQDEFLLAGQEDRQTIEIAVDERTYLPKMLKKYSQDSGKTGQQRHSLMEVRFLWNQPILREVFIPGSHDAK
ncbi:MAG TPA: anti-sigma factor [Acidobacteriota bacterium]|nr:anti-sigma factor [Acidobacteriota bacterium]